MNLSKSLMLLGLVVLPAAMNLAHAAEQAPLAERFDTLGQGVALGGFDPVSYFPEGGGKPTKGFVQRDFKYQGVTYRFASDANRDAFRAHPEKYVPAYNGWCAWAMAELNAKVDIEPTSFEIYNGKLYVFYDHADLNTRALWLKNPQAMLSKSEANWKTKTK